jgi:hypothetical protein
MKLKFAALILITLVAGWLRFTGASFGLPDTFRPDEEYIISRAWGFERDWNPNFAIYPAAQMYVDHLALVLNARVQGVHESFRQAYSSFGQVYLLIRRVSAGFGTATIPAIYFAAAPLGTATALGASALMAAATLHVRESKYATTDAGAVFWITLCLAMIVRIALTGKGRYYLAAGLLAGFATATKYPAGVLVPAIAVAHLEARIREGRSLWRSFRDIRIFVAGFGAIVAFVCGTPYFFLDWTQTVGDYQYQRGFVVDGLANPQTTYGVRWLLFHAAPESFGIVMMGLFLAAMIWMALRPRLATYPLLAFVLVACVSMTRSHYVFYRYLVFPLPALILLAAAFLADLAGLAAPRLGPRAAGAALCGLLGLLIWPSLLRDIELDRLLLQPDSRVVAREWIEHNIPPGSRIAVTDMGNQCGKPRLPPYYQMVPMGPVEALRAHQVNWVLSDYLPQIAFYSSGPSPSEEADLMQNAKLVLNVNPIMPGKGPPVFDPNDAYYAPIARISSMNRAGPIIRIWRLD